MKRKILGIVLVVVALLCIGCYNNAAEKSVVSEEPVQVAAKMPVEEVEMAIPEKGVPVLMYHMVGDIEGNPAVINEPLFREQMKFLHEQGYNTITLDQLYEYVTANKPVPLNPVVLTFDDGYLDTYTIVYPLLKEYDMNATVFINPGDIGQRLTWEQVKEMSDNGIVISNHGYLHNPMNDTMTREEQYQNIAKAQAMLKEKLGIDNKYFCYPYGIFDEQVQEMLKEQGIKVGLAMSTGWAHNGDNPLAIERVWIGNAVTLPYYEERITSENFTHF